ncbi:MAG: LysM peptidoglycan-binding domain-containing protein [Thermoanaerobaculia bacterium]|nr:LysM peptidoglycan-binding domain-containing protein [Thermoanaerobaculia bacterium]
MSLRSFLSALIVGLLLAPLAGAADRPPTNLRWTGDHWTAWDPPTEFPEGSRIHVVVPGDTLWDLARQHLGDPYLWPQIWEKNQYVLDAHWIYPGDPLVLDLSVTPMAPLDESAGAAGMEGAAAGEGEEGTGQATATAGGPRFDPAASGPPQPLGYEDDIYCTGYLGEEDETFALAISGSEYQALSPRLPSEQGTAKEGIFGLVDTVKYRMDVGDIVYLDGGESSGLAPGTLLTAVEPQQALRHPLTREPFGRFYRYLGRVRVVSVQETSAIAEIVHSCDGMAVGARLVPFEAEPVPLARRSPMRPASDPAPAEAIVGAPTIVWAFLGAVSIAQDHVVFIDRGAEHGVSPGDVYTVYRTNREGFPPVVLGELAVLSVKRRSATARILESRFPIYVGDRLELK